MPRTGTINGFYFDPEVFTDYMQEQSPFKNAIIASKVLRYDATIDEKIGKTGNVGTMPIYNYLDIDTYAPVNYDGSNDNTPQAVSAKKQTFMSIGRMKAFKDADFTRELTGAKPLENVANQVNDYYGQVWQKDLMSIAKGVMGVSGLATHKTNLAVTTGTITDANKISANSAIQLMAKALGDSADRFKLIVMNSAVYATLLEKQLVEFAKYTVAGGTKDNVELPTYLGRIVLVDDRDTVDTTVSGYPVYHTWFFGEGAFLTSDKYVENPYYVEYDAETDGGVNKLYTKQNKIIHPNGMSIAAGSITAESPTTSELASASNWSLVYNHKNVAIAELLTNG